MRLKALVASATLLIGLAGANTGEASVCGCGCRCPHRVVHHRAHHAHLGYAPTYYQDYGAAYVPPPPEPVYYQTYYAPPQVYYAAPAYYDYGYDAPLAFGLGLVAGGWGHHHGYWGHHGYGWGGGFHGGGFHGHGGFWRH